MGLMAKEGGGKQFDPVSEGVHAAVCYSIFDLGTQHDEKFDKDQHKVLLIWELPGERIEIEKDGATQDLPRVISRKYTLSLGDKANLRKDLETWRGRSFTKEEKEGFDLKNVLAKSCQLQVIHKTVEGKTYANISAIIPMPKGSKPLVPENPVRFYSIADDRDQIPEGTPKWIVDQIKESDEWKYLVSGGDRTEEPPPPLVDDEIPF